MALDSGNLPVASSRKEKLFKLVAVSFGLLCVLQAALNISLRLTLYSSDNNSPGIEASCKNLTEERDELKRKLADFNRTTLDMEIRLKTLTEERDELKMKLIDFFKANYSQPEWTYFNGSLYYVSSSQKTWQKSRDYCLQKGADLMIINSKEEQNFTRQLKDNLWIGLTDRETEGTWKWVDGTPLTTSFWLSNEPNSYELKEEDCGEIRYHEEENNWNDKPCDLANFWICEKKLPL